MFFSIVIPYRKSKQTYLDNSIESLKKQVCADFEVIFVYKTSSYTATPSLDSDLIINYVEVSDMCSSVDMKNEGIKQASGEYILFLDGDDYLDPDALIYAKQIIEEDVGDSNVLRLGVAKTYLDFASTLEKRRIAYNRNVEENEAIEKMYALGLIRSGCNSINSNSFFKKLNYKFNVHGFIFKKSFIEEHSLIFDFKGTLYEDIPFLTSVYTKMNEIKQTSTKLYYKYIHSDPFNFPSRTQENLDYRILTKVQAYRIALRNCEDHELSKKLKKITLNYYLYTVIRSPQFRLSFIDARQILEEFSNLLNENDLNVPMKRTHRFEIRALKKKNYRKAYFLGKMRLKTFEMYSFFKLNNKSTSQKLVQLIFNFSTSKLSIKKETVLFESFNGKSPSDSPLAIYNDLINKADNRKLYWAVKRANVQEAKGRFPHVNIVPRFSIKWIFIASRAHFWVFNARMPHWLNKNKNTVYIQTWHGTPLKKLGVDIDEVSMPGTNTNVYKKNFTYEASRWDYLIAPNQYSKEIFARAFNFNNKFLDISYPRNDILFQHAKDTKKINNTKMNILGTDKGRVILYAPTWRDDYFISKGNYKFFMPFSLEKVMEHLNEDDILIIRPHYLVGDSIDIRGYEKNIRICIDEDINELYLISDLLITDYSSVMFDYAVLKRPMLFYAYDMEHYAKNLRGFYFDYQDVPGPIVEKEADFYQKLSEFNSEGIFMGYENKFDNFYNKFVTWENPHSSSIVSNIILESKK